MMMIEKNLKYSLQKNFTQPYNPPTLSSFFFMFVSVATVDLLTRLKRGMLMWKQLLSFYIQWKGAKNAAIQWEYVHDLNFFLTEKKRWQELFHIVNLQNEQQSTMQLVEVFSQQVLRGLKAWLQKP